MALSYAYAFRYYLKGENKQSYFDCIVQDLSQALEIIDPATPVSPKQNMTSFFSGLSKVFSIFSKDDVKEESPEKVAD